VFIRWEASRDGVWVHRHLLRTTDVRAYTMKQTLHLAGWHRAKNVSRAWKIGHDPSRGREITYPAPALRRGTGQGPVAKRLGGRRGGLLPLAQDKTTTRQFADRTRSRARTGRRDPSPASALEHRPRREGELRWSSGRPNRERCGRMRNRSRVPKPGARVVGGGRGGSPVDSRIRSVGAASGYRAVLRLSAQHLRAGQRRRLERPRQRYRPERASRGASVRGRRGSGCGDLSQVRSGRLPRHAVGDGSRTPRAAWAPTRHERDCGTANRTAAGGDVAQDVARKDWPSASWTLHAGRLPRRGPPSERGCARVAAVSQEMPRTP